MKEDLIKCFQCGRKKFNQSNKCIREKAKCEYKDDPNNYETFLKDDDIGLEDFGRQVQ